MNILLISQFFPPETGACSVRIEEFVRSWTSKGHKISIVTNYPNYPNNRIYKGYKNSLFEKENYLGATVFRVFTYVNGSNNIVNRALGQMLFMLLSIIAGIFVKKHDVIIVTSPPFTIGITAVFLKFIKGVPFVFDVRDPYPLAAIELGVIKNKFLRKILCLIERLIYKKSDRVITVTKGFREFIIESGCPPHKIDIVPNGVNFLYFKKEKMLSRRKIASEFGLKDKFNIVYTGTLGRVHNLELMIEVSRKLKHDTSMQFIIVGQGIKKSNLAKLISCYNLKNVFLLDPISKDEVKRFLGIADIGFQALEDINYISGAHAIKIFEYMSMEIPVVFSGRGESYNLVKNSGCGVPCSQNSVDEVVKAIISLKENSKLRRICGKKGRKFIKKYFNRQMHAEKFIDLLRNY